MSDFQPTDEQVEALRLFKTGGNLAIQAGAGTGKTRTLQLLAESCPDRVGIFTAFNKAIVTDAGTKMPSSTTCATMHSLAMRAVGRRYAHRLNSGRMKSNDIARRLRIDPIVVTYGTQRKPLAAGFLAGLTMRAVARFCQSGDAAPDLNHVPYVDGIDTPYPDGRRGYSNNDEVRRHILPAMRSAWEDLSKVDGTLPFRHEHYLKIFERSNPVLMADFVMVDEAQDLSGVMISIVEAQAENTQLVFVGDSAQSINEWMGAIDALGKVPADETTFLTRSFRFGPAVADVANGLLTRLAADLRLTGAASHASVVAAVAEPTCILTRTNAEAVRTVLSVQEQGRTPFLMGGGSDVIAFCRGAQDLLAGRWTSHQDLTCFGTWNEVQEYVDHDPQGSDLALLVKLIDDFGVDTIITALSNSVPESSADVTVSTAHKSKGCEWDSVQLAGDFFTPRDGADDVAPAELKLLYVACTRARRELDVTLVPHAVKAPAAKPIPLPAADVPGEAPTSPQEARDGCPLCGRTDVLRGGLIGAHRCATAEVAP